MIRLAKFWVAPGVALIAAVFIGGKIGLGSLMPQSFSDYAHSFVGGGPDQTAGLIFFALLFLGVPVMLTGLFGMAEDMERRSRSEDFERRLTVAREDRQIQEILDNTESRIEHRRGNHHV